MTRTLLIPVLVWALAQVIKAFLRSSGRPTLRSFLISGGMPSAHSALAAALATQVGLVEGFDSTLFAVTAVFAGIVAYDAMGVRRASGEQARLVNRLVERVLHGNRSDLERLREELGHQPAEVGAGIGLGVALPLLLHTLLP